ncbi:Glycosyltransferase [Fulvivirga imtechensis AK7]|uniref:Glycosyltransferase n=2 Tax=Fulvivirga TaxID=396811 RepID=L8JJP5_9BACT|nr:Glycosyltransferase [Fulvivirga imtechensis AK7]
MTTDTAGGVWHYSIDLVAGLLREQVKVVLVAMGPKLTEAQRADLHQCRGVKFYHKTCKLEWMDSPWNDVEKAGQWLTRIYEKEQPDLIHFNNYAHVNMGWDCPKILVAHSCVSSWWEAVKKEPLPGRFNYYFNVVREAFHGANMVVAPSAAMLSTFQRIYGHPERSTVIYNALAPSKVSTDKQPIIFSMGRLWDEAKNIDLLLKAADNINGKIYIAGAGSREKNNTANVTFLGILSRPEIFGWLNISAIYVLPVKYEPFGLSFLEAASRRCALVGGDIATMRELWGESMCYVEPDNPEALAHTCNTLLSDVKYRNCMAAEAYKRSQRYTLKKKTEQYINLYNNVRHESHTLLT